MRRVETGESLAIRRKTREVGAGMNFGVSSGCLRYRGNLDVSMGFEYEPQVAICPLYQM